jgi:hypothetical protein
MNIEHFFGLALDQNIYDIDQLADFIGIKSQINSTKNIQELIAATSPNHLIVSIAKRQHLLKMLRGLLEKKFLPYDQQWGKTGSVASAKDRQYEAEEKLIGYCLVLASGKTYQDVKNGSVKPDAAAIRQAPPQTRYSLLWNMLADNTSDAILQYRKQKNDAGDHKQSLFSKIKGFIASATSQKADP